MALPYFSLAFTKVDYLRLNQSTFISVRVVTLPEQTLGFKKGILVRDPDGHALRLIEKPEM